MDNRNVVTMKPLKFRSIWISDIHLGHRACKAEFLLDFLKHTRCEQLYLVGDVIDLWNMKNGWYWPQSHNNVIRSILGKAKRGTKVTYIPGNHDEMFRNYTNTSFGEVDIVAEAIHETADGRQLLVLHGDEFDSIVKHNKSIAHLGSQAYDFLLWVNHYIDMFRRKLGFPYWSLATYLKHKVKNAVKYISNFEKAVIHEARRRKVDGLVCGHIHKAAIKEYEGILYCNDGDWVESCSALVEHHDGTLEILNWTDTDKFKEELHSIENNNRRGRLVSAN